MPSYPQEYFDKKVNLNFGQTALKKLFFWPAYENQINYLYLLSIFLV